MGALGSKEMGELLLRVVAISIFLIERMVSSGNGSSSGTVGNAAQLDQDAPMGVVERAGECSTGQSKESDTHSVKVVKLVLADSSKTAYFLCALRFFCVLSFSLFVDFFSVFRSSSCAIMA